MIRIFSVFLMCVVLSFPLISLANSNNVELVGFLDVGGTSMIVVGKYAYLAKTSRLTVLDISDPDPTKVAEIFTPCENLVFYEDHIYASAGRKGVTIIDVSNPIEPVEVGKLTIAEQRHAIDVDINDGYAYIATAGDGFHIKNLNVWQSNFHGKIGYAVRGICASEGYAYLVGVPYSNAPDGDWPGHLTILNVDNPLEPAWVWECRIPGPAFTVRMSDGYVYVGYTSDLGISFQIIDVLNPEEPIELGHYNSPGIGGGGGIYVLDGYVYMAAGTAGLRVIDVSNPENPTEVGFYEVPPDAFDVSISDDGHIYMASGGSTYALRYDESIGEGYAVEPKDKLITAWGSVKSEK